MIFKSVNTILKFARSGFSVLSSTNEVLEEQYKEKSRFIS